MIQSMLIAVALQAAAPAEADRQALESLNATWLNSYVTGDSTALGEILAEDFVATYGGGIRRTRAQILAGMASPRRPVVSVRWENLSVQLAGDTAVVTARSILRLGGEAGETEVRNDYADVYVRRNGRWQAIAAHVVRAPEP